MNTHFQTVPSWQAAEALLTFRPVVPAHTEGFTLQSIQIHVRDHRQRELPVGERTLEAHYGGFVFSQTHKGEAEARRLTLEVSYGRAPQEARIVGREARLYDLGPEVEPDDIDGQMPAVVVWHDGGILFLIASGDLASEALVRIAGSVYRPS